MLSKNFDLSGRNALITGAAGLLGIEHCEALLECNANLVLIDINYKKLCEVKSYLINKYPKNKLLIYAADLTLKQSLLDIKNDLLNKNLDINILINNAAINPNVDSNNKICNASRLESFSLEEWNKQIAVGLTGSFLCCQIFGAEMAKLNKPASIVNIASDLSVIAPDQRLYKKYDVDDSNQPVKPVTYSVIKSGLIGLTKYVSTYWLGSDIRCNALSPGGIYTNQPEDFVTKLSSLIPLGRMARKDEYRAAIQFLCSDASSYMNGHNLVIDGGRSTW